MSHMVERMASTRLVVWFPYECYWVHEQSKTWLADVIFPYICHVRGNIFYKNLVTHEKPFWEISCQSKSAEQGLNCLFSDQVRFRPDLISYWNIATTDWNGFLPTFHHCVQARTHPIKRMSCSKEDPHRGRRLVSCRDYGLHFYLKTRADAFHNDPLLLVTERYKIISFLWFMINNIISSPDFVVFVMIMNYWQATTLSPSPKPPSPYNHLYAHSPKPRYRSKSPG